MSVGEKKSVYIYLGLAVLVIILIGMFKDSIFGFGRNGGISINHLEKDSIVFIDNKESRRTNSSDENITLRGVSSGLHTILISRDGYWPWFKEVDVKKGETSSLTPFLVLSNPSGFLIAKEDKDYNSITTKINSVKLPGFNNKKVSSDGSVAMWVDKDTLFVEWLLEEAKRPDYFCNEFGCHNVFVPLGLEAQIRNVEFYRERSDVFIVAFGDGVFALEADNKNNQNFQPIYEGVEPQFILGEDNESLYIYDANLLRQVVI